MIPISVLAAITAYFLIKWGAVYSGVTVSDKALSMAVLGFSIGVPAIARFAMNFRNVLPLLAVAASFLALYSGIPPEIRCEMLTAYILTLILIFAEISRTRPNNLKRQMSDVVPLERRSWIGLWLIYVVSIAVLMLIEWTVRQSFNFLVFLSFAWLVVDGHRWVVDALSREVPDWIHFAWPVALIPIWVAGAPGALSLAVWASYVLIVNIGVRWATARS